MYKEVNYKSAALKEINLDLKEKEMLLADDCQNAKILSKTHLKCIPLRNSWPKNKKLFTNGSSAVNGCRQDASPNSW